MKLINKIVVHYTDGTSETIYGNNPLPIPAAPNTPQVDPYKLPTPFPDPYIPFYEGKRICPKCGITIEGVMGYVCPHNNCPTGLGGVQC